jgi:hypothetical protein
MFSSGHNNPPHGSSETLQKRAKNGFKKAGLGENRGE